MQLEEVNEARLLEGQVRLELKQLELSKLEAKLNSRRDDWLARVDELRAEMQHVLSEKEALEECLANKLYEEQKIAEQALTQAKLSFDVEMSTLTDYRNELHQKCLERKQNNIEKESYLRDISLRLSVEIDKSIKVEAAFLQSQVSKIEALKARLEKQLSRRAELEEHFARVDRNNAATKIEEERLRHLVSMEAEATKLLFRGACGLQKLWRGMAAREQFAKMKKKTKRGNAKNGRGKKG
ncbi:hypothetical protein ACHAXM_005512 [Skeletonema potamos]